MHSFLSWLALVAVAIGGVLACSASDEVRGVGGLALLGGLLLGVMCGLYERARSY